MKTPDSTTDASVRARLVHKSLLVDHPGVATVTRLMLNLSPGNVPFVPGANIGVVPPGVPADHTAAALRFFTIESVGEVPFEDTVDITLFVREPKHDEPADAARLLTSMELGDGVELFGPVPYPFYPPMGSRSNMIMIGAGCGMVPFRWLVRNIHGRRLDWMGKVLMLQGAQTGLEHVYSNDRTRDQDQFFDTASFRAFEALKTRYTANALDRGESISANRDAFWRLLGQGSVFVYLAGYRKHAQALDAAMTQHLRLKDRWHETKAALKSDGHWLEHLYD